jgi:Thiolase-like protein type 1 additional C-terminal domain
VLGAAPSGNGFRSDSVQAAVDALPSRPTATDSVATATLEAYTVNYDRTATPERALLACLDDGGSRHYATSTDAATIDELLTGDRCGRAVRLSAGVAELAG